MKSRLAMMAMLVFGILMSGTGASLAISGISSSGDASIAQYDVPCDRNGDGVVDGNEDLNGDAPGCDEFGVLPGGDEGDNDCDTNGDGVISPSEAAAKGCGGVLDEEDEGGANEPTETPTVREEAAQPARQTEAGGDDELPFTGFAAVPILIGGVALLGGGLVLRRRTS